MDMMKDIFIISL